MGPGPATPDAPIITFLTDFGLTDSYVAEMKAFVLRGCGNAILVDITHQIPRHDVLAGSIALQRAVAAFPAGTIHLAVVDPGVGTSRRLLAAVVNEQVVLCPDNGLITWAHTRYPAHVRELHTLKGSVVSPTFHGRDILAPAAARLARTGLLGEQLGSVLEPILLPERPAPPGARAGAIIHIDHFGNLTTNLGPATTPAGELLRVQAGKWRLPVLTTYGDVQAGQPLTLVGSGGLLEIAVREGSAAETVGLKVGDDVQLVE